MFIDEYDGFFPSSYERTVRGFFGTASIWEYVQQISAYVLQNGTIIMVSGEVRQGHSPVGDCLIEKCAQDFGGNWDWAFSQTHYRFYNYNWTNFHLFEQNCMDWAAEVMLERNEGELH